jgi:oligopeptide transport system substrate-binding protein
MRKLVVLLCVLALAVPVFGETVFRIANGANPQSLDTHLTSGVPEQRLFDALYEGLMIPSPATGNPVLGAAESYTVSPDGTVYTFKIRKGLTWSDGVPITARTFYESWLRCLDPATAAEYPSIMTDIIKGAADYNSGKTGPDKVAMRVVDLQTFQFTTVGPAPYVLSMLTHMAYNPVPMHVIKKYGGDWTLPEHFVGNGAFVLQSFTPNDKIVVVKNPKYWDAKNVKLDQIVFYLSDDQATTYKMYVNGEVDWDASNPPPDKIDEAKARPQKDYILSPILSVYYYLVNVNQAPFTDVRVRQAFSMSVGRKNITDQIMKGGQIPATNGVPPNTGGYTGPTGIQENIEGAKKLLADAGYPGGKGLPTIKILYNTSAGHKKIAEYLQQQWEQTLGAKVELVNQEWATYLQTRQDGKMGGFELARAGWGYDFADPYNYLFMWLSDNLNFNDPRWKNAKYDELVKKTNSLPAGPERNKLFYDAETILNQELPVIPFYFYVSQHMIDLTKWGGWNSNSLDRHTWKFIFKK